MFTGEYITIIDEYIKMSISFTLSLINNKYILYSVRIFGPKDYPIPIQFRYKNTSRAVTFWYHQTFKVSQFIHDLFCLIGSSTNRPLMDKQLEMLSDLYFNDIDDNEEDDVDNGPNTPIPSDLDGPTYEWKYNLLSIP